MGMPDPRKLPHLVQPRHDPLKHFSREKPGWKLAALLVDRFSTILYGLAAACAAALPFLLK